MDLFRSYAARTTNRVFPEKTEKITRITVVSVVPALEICRAGQEQTFGSWPKEKKIIRVKENR